MQAANAKRYYSPQEVARMFLVSPITVRSWAEKGWLHAEVTAGGHRRYLAEAVAQFARARGLPMRSAMLDPMQILVVDDDRHLTAYLQELFSDTEPTVQLRFAHDGFEAGILLRQFVPQVVILDVRMPGMDGVQVCERIKCDPTLRGIRVIGLTGAAIDEDVARLSAAGAECCLAKPVDTRLLFQVLGLQHANAG